MSTYTEIDDDEAKEYYEYEQNRLKLFIDKMKLQEKKNDIKKDNSPSYESTIRKIILQKDNNSSWNKSTCSDAALRGHLEYLKYAHENGYVWDKSTCSYAALRGHLDCLRYTHENGCPWDERTCSFAAQNGHLDCLKYAHLNGCKWDESTCSDAALRGLTTSSLKLDIS